MCELLLVWETTKIYFICEEFHYNKRGNLVVEKNSHGLTGAQEHVGYFIVYPTFRLGIMHIFLGQK